MANTFKNVMRQQIKKEKEKEQTEKKPASNNVAPCIIEIDGLCKMLNIGKNTAYNLLTSGEIDSFKVGSVWKIPVSSINEYIERKCREPKLVKMYTVVKRDRDLYFERHGDLPIKY
jgi:excisionase family DNA binding protein